MMLDRVRLEASAKLNRQQKVELNILVSSAPYQVNSTALRLMKYPSREMLISLGRWASRQDELSQEKIGNEIRELCMA